MRRIVRSGVWAVAAWLVLVGGARAGWDPATGQWGKTEATDLRVMTWNIEDGICSTAAKGQSDNYWAAIVRIVAAFKPDVLFLQEAGDNAGNGTGGSVDSVSVLTTTCDLFLHGGVDPFVSGNPQVTEYVQKYDPAFDLPYVFVANRTDGYNRNVILSRFAFGDLNGDTKSTYSNVLTVSADGYAPGGSDSIIRGFQFAEIPLDDGTYYGDVVVGTAHLKAGSTSSDLAERLAAAQNVAYFIDYWYNGAGSGIPDPNNKIADSPVATAILEANTPVVIGGDWNEDEQTNGRRGPADWLTQAATLGGTDGTDRDRSDMTYDASLVVKPSGTPDRTTLGSVKYDYLAWQDSIATLRRSFIFRSTVLGSTPSWFPPEIASFGNPSNISVVASDHRPVIADLILPHRACLPPGDSNCDGLVNNQDIDSFVKALYNKAAWLALNSCDFYCANDLSGDGFVNNQDIDGFVHLLFGG